MGPHVDFVALLPAFGRWSYVSNGDVPSSENPPPGPGPRLPLGVVVVDDDPTIRMLLVRLVEADRRFWVVGTAADGHEAVEVVTTRRPDLVVLDVSLPQMDGIAAAAQIRAVAPGVQVVMCSSDRGRRYEAVRAGADVWVDKPIDYDRLSSVMLAAATEMYQRPPPEADRE